MPKSTETRDGRLNSITSTIHRKISNAARNAPAFRRRSEVVCGSGMCLSKTELRNEIKRLVLLGNARPTRGSL